MFADLGSKGAQGRRKEGSCSRHTHICDVCWVHTWGATWCKVAARWPRGGRREAAGRPRGDYDTLAGSSLRSILRYFVLRNEVYRIYHAVGPEARRI